MKNTYLFPFLSQALGGAAAVAAMLLACHAATAAQSPKEPVQPIPAVKITDPAKVELGKKLFFEPRLSRSGFISCNSCHNLSMGGTDNLRTSIGDKWQKGPINSPTVLNSSLNLAQFWDGRAKNLKEQAGGPIANPAEMALSHELSVDMLRSIPQYVAEFKRVFHDDKLSFDDVTAAIAAFEETLVTPNAPFDKWLKGDKRAINEQQLRGYQLFKSSGCVACHNGVNIGGTSFQKMGMVEPYKTDNPAVGRSGVTGNAAERFMFKVPTLRNVALTYPYFHDGAAATLSQAVETMGRIQLGKTFTHAENEDIVAFLNTLTGDQPKVTLPVLPPSNEKTKPPQPFE